MKRILSLILILCTILPTGIVNSYAYNEPHTFQTQLEDARNKTVFISTWHNEYYPWMHTSTILTTGTGTMIGDGLLLTNAHVIGKDQNDITIKDYEGKVYSGELLRVDKDKDLALIKFDSDADGFTLSDVDLYRGMPVMTVGQPVGLPQWSFSEGTVQIVSLTYTDNVGSTQEGIYTDAEVKGGNSGGPLLDSNGELVGIIRAGGGGYSCAVPMVDIKEFLKEEEKND